MQKAIRELIPTAKANLKKEGKVAIAENIKDEVLRLYRIRKNMTVENLLKVLNDLGFKEGIEGETIHGKDSDSGHWSYKSYYKIYSRYTSGDRGGRLYEKIGGNSPQMLRTDSSRAAFSGLKPEEVSRILGLDKPIKRKYDEDGSLEQEIADGHVSGLGGVNSEN